MAEKFDPKNASKLENPDRLVEMPPAKLVKLLELTGAETVVDFGAGTGMYSIPLAEALPDGELIAVDEQEVLLDQLRDKLATHQPAGRLRVVVSSDVHVPLPDGVADRLIAINVVHHINDDASAMAEMLRLITPGGLFVCAEFARMERPFGPPNDHVMALDDLRATLTGVGLREHAVYEPGEVALHHNVVVVQKPSA